jgi:hypothetical protein
VTDPTTFGVAAAIMPDKTHFLARLRGVEIAGSFEAALVEIGRTRATAAHAYFRRIDALDYLQDDGQRVEDPEGALAAKLGGGGAKTTI